MDARHHPKFTGTTLDHITCIDKVDDADENWLGFVEERRDPGSEEPYRFVAVFVDTPADRLGPRLRAEGPYDEKRTWK